MKLPSNKASVLILVIVILSTLIFISSDYFEKPPTNSAENSAKIVVENEIKKTNINSDTDGDGLLNWEETLWGTDPNNIDTDGDGTNDFDETKQNRNPLVAGPNDEDISPEERILKEIEENSVLDENGLTSAVAVNLAENYFTMRGDGGLDQTEKDFLVNEIVKKSTPKIVFEDKYKIYSIKTFNQEDNSYNDKLITYADYYLSSQALIFGLFAPNPGVNSYTELGNYVAKISEGLLSVETPEEIKEEQLKLLNTLYNLGKITKEFDKEDEDPLYVMLILPLYEDLLTKLKDINNNLGEFLEASGIIIKDNLIQIENE